MSRLNRSSKFSASCVLTSQTIPKPLLTMVLRLFQSGSAMKKRGWNRSLVTWKQTSGQPRFYADWFVWKKKWKEDYSSKMIWSQTSDVWDLNVPNVPIWKRSHISINNDWKRKVTSAVINEEICKVNRSNKGISKHNLEADKKWRNQ